MFVCMENSWLIQSLWGQNRKSENFGHTVFLIVVDKDNGINMIGMHLQKNKKKNKKEETSFPISEFHMNMEAPEAQCWEDMVKGQSTMWRGNTCIAAHKSVEHSRLDVLQWILTQLIPLSVTLFVRTWPAPREFMNGSGQNSLRLAQVILVLL